MRLPLLGVGGNILPVRANLAAWYDASDTPTVISDGARQFITASSRYFSRADDANFSTGDIDFWMAGWVYFDTVATNMSLFGKWDSPANQREYLIFFEPGAGNTITFGVSNDGSSAAVISSGVTPSTATWYFVLAWHDSVNNTINIKVNNGTTQSTAHTTGVFNGTAATAIGAHDINTTPLYFLNGRMDSWCFGKNPVGGIAGLISALNTSLYNGGAGKTYAQLSASEKTNWGLVAFYNLAENAGSNATDAYAGLTFTASGSAPTAAAGIVAGIASNGDVVSQWTDKSGNSRNAVQTTVGNKPLLQSTGGPNSTPSILFDGSNDNLSVAYTQAQPNTKIAVYKIVSWALSDNVYGAGNTVVMNGSTPEIRISSSGGSQVAGNTNLAVGTYGIVTAIWNGASSSLQINNTTATTGNPGTGDHSGNYLASTVTPSAWGNVQFCEFLHYSAALDSTQTTLIKNYLSAKWGISL